MRRQIIWRMSVGVAIFALCGLTVGVVGAQRPDGGSSPQAGQPVCRPGPVGELLGEFAARLGANLGASEDEVRAVLPQTLDEMRPQIEARVRQICQPGQAQPGPGGPPSPGGAQPGPGSAVAPEVVLGVSARLLGLEPEALRMELEQGKSLAAIAEEQGVDPDALADQLTQALEQFRLQQMRQGIRRFLEQPILPPSERPDR